MISSSSNLFSPIKSNDKKKLTIKKSIIYSEKKEKLKKHLNLSNIYKKRISIDNFKTLNKKIFPLQSNKITFKKKIISFTQYNSHNNSLIIKNPNSSDLNYENRNYDKSYSLFKKFKEKKNNSINLNKQNNSSSWRSMSIGFNDFSLLSKRTNFNLNITETNFQKIILIQSFLRRYLLRKKIFKEITDYYCHNSSMIKIKKVLENFIKNLFIEVIEKIYLMKEQKYYLNFKEYELLVELHKRKIYSKNDWINYFNKLINGTLISDSNNIKNKNKL